MTLVNLSNEGTNQETIVMQGALPLLIKLATVQDTEAARYAGMVLANLAANRRNRGPIVSLGGLHPLTMMSFSKSLRRKDRLH